MCPVDMLRLLFLTCTIYGFALGDDSDVPVVTLNFGDRLDPDDINVGDDVYFKCKIKNNPNPLNITWFHNGKELHHNVTDGVILSDRNLGLQNVTRHRAGSYTCLAANSEVNITSNEVNLKVMFEPICKGARVNWYPAYRNETVLVRCEVDAYPLVNTFQWTFNNTEGEAVLPSSRYITQGMVSNLNHTIIRDMDFGSFTCRAVNSVGPMKTPCVYHIIAVPEPNTTTQYLQNVPEDSNISHLLASKDRFDGGVYGDTDGKYYLFHFETTWIQAMEVCFLFGKRPATFNSEAEYHQLTDLLRKKNGNDLKASYWTGGSDLGKTGMYVWHSTGRPIKYTQWNSGEPDHGIYGNELEHCIELRADNGYKMTDGICSNKNYLICENMNTY